MIHIEGMIGFCARCKDKKNKPVLYMHLHCEDINDYVHLCPAHLAAALKKFILADIQDRSARQDDIPF